jgi:uncharacterized protein
LHITSIIWLEEIADKLAWKHKVTREEVREVFSGGSRRFRFVEKGFQTGDDLYAVLGRTHAGRKLVVFFVYKKDGAALIISGRDMSDKERRKYGKK